MWNRICIYISFLLMGVFLTGFLPQHILSQTVYKEICDSLPLAKNAKIEINSRKSSLVITSWDKPMVWVKIRMSFSNADLSLARKELGFSRFNFINTGSGVLINNFFSIPGDIDKIKSIIKIDYTVKIPNGVVLVINNEYGACSITGLNALAFINNKYGEINLNNFTGKTRIYAALCDIRATGLFGSSEFYVSNSNINLKNINGEVMVQNKVGKLSIEPGYKLKHLKVTCSYNDIDLLVRDLYNFNYHIQGKSASIEVGERFRAFPFTKKTKDLIEYSSDHSKSYIEISASFNSIKLH